MAVKSRDALVKAGAVGSGIASGAAGATQQQRQISCLAQQPHADATVVVESTWAAAIA